MATEAAPTEAVAETPKSKPDAGECPKTAVRVYHGFTEHTYRLVFPFEDRFAPDKPHLFTIVPSGIVENCKVLEPQKQKGLITFAYPQSISDELTGLPVGQQPGSTVESSVATNGNNNCLRDTAFIWRRQDNTNALVQTWPTNLNEKFRQDFEISEGANPDSAKFQHQAVSEFKEAMVKLFGPTAASCPIMFCHKKLVSTSPAVVGLSEAVLAHIKEHPDLMRELAIACIDSDSLGFVADGTNGKGQKFEKNFRLTPGEKCVVYRKTGWGTMGCIKPLHQFLSDAQFHKPVVEQHIAVAVGSEQPTKPTEPKILFPPAKSIFNLQLVDRSASGNAGCARLGELLSLPTPRFSVLTSRGFPTVLRPGVMQDILQGQQLVQLPVGDLLIRVEDVEKCPQASDGCRGFWPHLKANFTYCSYRNPRHNPSVYGGDTLCSVETTGGRRKVGPKEALSVQRVMRTNILAAPGEEVTMDVVGARRGNRAVQRATEWLKEILEAKATEPELAFDWHVLASIQGGGDLKIRQKACTSAAAMPVAGFWVGGLGYDESPASRAKVLGAVTSALPPGLPRFLPLTVGTPIEVLQAVLLGIDVLELTYPAQTAHQGIALTFSCDMPADAEEGDAASVLSALFPPPEPETPEAAGAALPAREVLQLQLRSPECREDFHSIMPGSPVSQYCRAYLCHLLDVRELLGTMLLTQHNLDMYVHLFEAIRQHIAKGTLGRFASWFLRTQTREASPVVPAKPASKRRKI